VFSETLLDHFKNPRNVGQLPPPATTVEVSNPACGDILRLGVLFEDGRAAQVRYQVRGCTASIAAGSALTELIAGRTRDELRAITPAAITEAVGGLAPASQHVAILCHDALKALIKNL
jgi:nitrogen fixation protein NifU and related proteins